MGLGGFVACHLHCSHYGKANTKLSSACEITPFKPFIAVFYLELDHEEMQWQEMNLNYIQGLNNPIVIIELIVDIMFIIDIMINFR